jgi:SAM-dependent methyltransferase
VKRKKVVETEEVYDLAVGKYVKVKKVRRRPVREVNLDLSENFQPKQKDYKVDSIKNLGKYKANSVDNIIFNGVLEQRTGLDRIPVMRAIHRALKPGGRAFATVAHWATAGASMSPYSQWPPLSPESFGFFSKETREASNYKNPEVADIDFDLSWSELYDPGWQSKADNVRAFATRHYCNVVMGLAMSLTKKEVKGKK